ncbi:hypothetical protein VTN00DRAFT_4640 [Thermoascus crustaceus]|uniref:uncharacterized protein n=1 Tax=Thermoascus crustaceus TaxID=5088 RepID=UPI003742A4E8
MRGQSRQARCCRMCGVAGSGRAQGPKDRVRDGGRSSLEDRVPAPRPACVEPAARRARLQPGVRPEYGPYGGETLAPRLGRRWGRYRPVTAPYRAWSRCRVHLIEKLEGVQCAGSAEDQSDDNER